MASLQDLLMLRELKNQADPFYSSMQALAQGVSQGIAAEQQRRLENKKRMDNIAGAMALVGATSNTKSGKLGSGTHRIKVGANLLTGEPTIDFVERTPTEIKAERDVAESRRIEGIRKEFFKPGSKLNVQDLMVAGIKPSDAEAMDNQRGVVNLEREFIKQEFDKQALQSINQSISQSNARIPTSGGIAVPRRTPAGKPKEFFDIDEQTRIDQAKANVAISKEVLSQEGKSRAKVKKALERSVTTTGVAQAAVTKFDKENFDKFGVKPGDWFGLFAKLQPNQTNAYKAAAEGAGREAAATVGIGIIPAARAVRMVELFAKSAAEIGNTQEGNAANTAFSNSNVWGNAIAENIEIETKNPNGTFSVQRIRDLVKDPLTGKPLSEIPYPEYLKAVQRAVFEFEEKAEEEFLRRTFAIEPRLLKPETISRLRTRVQQKKDKDRLEELRRKRDGTN